MDDFITKNNIKKLDLQPLNLEFVLGEFTSPSLSYFGILYCNFHLTIFCTICILDLLLYITHNDFETTFASSN